MKVLRDGWNDYFQDTKVRVWTYVINPRELLHFIENSGQKHVKDMLALNWDNIVARGMKRRAEKRAMDRKLKRIQALGDKTIYDQATAALQQAPSLPTEGRKFTGSEISKIRQVLEDSWNSIYQDVCSIQFLE
jgi:hypothetical protein